MRERSTWDRKLIAAAASKKVAEDPRAMNQDHLKQQPSADKYVTGDPSTFAEDVAPSNWKAEYSGGEVKRDEIGLPEMRPETFNHPEKTAAQQAEEDEVLAKKASVCIKLAQRVLPKTASERMLEDQALAFMHMPDSVLIDTYTRLASDEDQGQGQQDEGKQAQDQQQTQQQDGKQAGEIPPQFLEHMKKKEDGDDKDKGQDKKQAQDQQSQQQSEEEQKKQAQQQSQQQAEEEKQKQAQQQSQQQSDDEQKKQAALAGILRKACDAMAQGDMQLAQGQIQQMVQQAMGPQQMMSQDQMNQIQQMVQQAMQQQGQPAQQQPAVMADDQLLDQMLQTDVQASRQVAASSVGAASMDIEIEGPSMDVGEVHLGSDDEALTALFASSPEVQEAAHAHALQHGTPVQASAGMTRTAATRTVGTRPSGGVASLGGAVPAASGGNDVDKLSSLWQSAPDVKSVFG